MYQSGRTTSRIHGLVVTAPCPRCARANAAHRTTCLYCGAVMPAPIAPPPPKIVPANIDSLVRDALRGGGVGKLRAGTVAPQIVNLVDASCLSRLCEGWPIVAPRSKRRQGPVDPAGREPERGHLGKHRARG